VQVVSVVILSESSKQPLERFSFDVSSFPEIDNLKMHSLLIHEPNDSDENEVGLPGTSMAELGDQFRAVMQQLSACTGRLGKLPGNCTFTVMVELKEGSDPPINVSNSFLVNG
jgi:mitotic spindle assembly checkpoint protein MAD2B